jgi:hypothetical protein
MALANVDIISQLIATSNHYFFLQFGSGVLIQTAKLLQNYKLFVERPEKLT